MTLGFDNIVNVKVKSDNIFFLWLMVIISVYSAVSEGSSSIWWCCWVTGGWADETWLLDHGSSVKPVGQQLFTTWVSIIEPSLSVNATDIWQTWISIKWIIDYKRCLTPHVQTAPDMMSYDMMHNRGDPLCPISLYHYIWALSYLPLQSVFFIWVMIMLVKS